MKALELLQRFSNRCESALGFNGEYVATLGEINDAIVELEAQLANTEQLTCMGCFYYDKYEHFNYCDGCLRNSDVGSFSEIKDKFTKKGTQCIQHR